jgi:hypothetical protein
MLDKITAGKRMFQIIAIDKGRRHLSFWSALEFFAFQLHFTRKFRHGGN